MLMPPRHDSWIGALSVWAALALLGASAAQACGPFFPNQLLVGGDDAVLAPAQGDFSIEIARVRPWPQPPSRAVISPDHDPFDQSAGIDQQELVAAMTAANTPKAARDKLVDQYAHVRAVITSAARSQADRAEKDEPAQDNGPHSGRPNLDGADTVVRIPEGLPPEFDHYIRGLLAFRLGAADEARTHWRAVLALPPQQRSHRSTWAAYMLGRSYEKDDPQRALDFYHQVRALAGAGFADALGLSAASIGWEGRVELHASHFNSAIVLYATAQAAGDPEAAHSLRIAIGALWATDDAALRAAAADPMVAQLVTASMISTSPYATESPGIADPAKARKWLNLMETIGGHDVAGADRLAWGAYQAGDIGAAQRWLDRADPKEPMARWVRAKLLLRAGKLDQAAELLAQVSRQFPGNQQWNPEVSDDWMPESVRSPSRHARAEAGVLRLARRHYVAALEDLLRAGYWLDAAYIAERVLTPEELIAYVDAAGPPKKAKEVPKAPSSRDDKGETPTPPTDPVVEMRHLLARRLARLGRRREAQRYLSGAPAKTFATYIAHIRSANDKSRPAAARADDFWQAARIARHDGLEILGTELAPDWRALWQGNYELDPVEKQRATSHAKLTGPSQDELARAASSRPQPDARFHYRYVAADHAWSAVALMPDGDDQTAKRLCIAGRWLKDRDAVAADRFYKALVHRCGDTDLGRQAQLIKWFPPVAEEP